MKFNELVNIVLKENQTYNTHQSKTIIDSYEGRQMPVARLVGSKYNTQIVDSINGEESNEPVFLGVPFNKVVQTGIKIGLWEDDHKGNLVVVDSDKWITLYNKLSFS